MRKFTLCCTLILTAFQFILLAQSGSDFVDKNLAKFVAEKKISPSDASQWIMTSQNKSSLSEVSNFYFRQSFSGLEIFGTESSVHVLKNGQELNSSNKFVKNISSKIAGSLEPTKNQVEAVQLAVAHLGYAITEPLTIVSSNNSAAQETLVSKGGFSSLDIPVKLMFEKLENGNVVLVWALSIHHVSLPEWYHVRVNAETGAITSKNNWILACNFAHDHEHGSNNVVAKNDVVYGPFNKTQNSNLLMNGSYEVFGMPLENPLYGDRTILTDVVNSIASPFGWHDTNGVTGPEYTVTRGNNVNAFKSGGSNHGYQPDGGSSLVFHYPYTPNYSSGNTSLDASLTNLFYWNNIIHDVLYQYGFDEESGNFQQNNYGNGGAGNDQVLAHGQIGFDCNAYFGTPPDGSSGEMYMYVCSSSSKDGSFDNLVVAHEYGHGISNRLTGGPANTDCLWNAEQMGEGWSDWYGLMLTMKEGDQSTDNRGIGTYLFGYPAGGIGIREHYYTTSMTVNPHTYDDVKLQWGQHGIGSIWAAMLWELTWGLIDEYGFDPDFYNGTGGNNIAMALVTEGMRLQPCSPGFVDGRDAILAADMALFDGANQCIIWKAFAKRGLGKSASQGSSNSSNDGVEAFDIFSIECSDDIEIDLPVGTTTYILPDYYADGIVTLNGAECATELIVTQTPVAGTELGIGTHTITVEFEEADGFSGSCEFDLIITGEMGVADVNLTANSVQLFPNPTQDKVTIVNSSKTQIKTLNVVDTSGKLIQNIEWSNGSKQMEISLKSLPTGVYFIKLSSDKEEIVKSVIKK